MPKKPKKPKKTSKELEYLGKSIKTKRKKCGLTQGELAEQISRGLRHIQNIEGGLINPSYEVLSGIIQRLAMSMDCLVYPELPELEKDQKQLLCKLAACPEKDRKFFLDTMDFLLEQIIRRSYEESPDNKTE